MNSLSDAFAKFIVARRGLVWLLLIVGTAFAAAGYRWNRQVEPESTESRQDREKLRVATDDFGRQPAQCYLVVDLDGQAFTPPRVSALRQVVAAVESLDYVEDVDWVDTIPVLNIFGLRESLLPPEGSTAAQFSEAGARALRHPLIRGQLISDDARTLLMPIRIDDMLVTGDGDYSERILETARNRAASIPSNGIVRIRVTGPGPLFLAQKRAFDHNQVKFQVISYALVFLISLALFRHFAPVLIVAGGPALGIFWSQGLLNVLNESSNPLTSVVLPVLLTMVGLADGVHLMVHIRRKRADGSTSEEAAQSAIRHVGAACALTSLTTAVGFGSLMVAESKYVVGFGKSCAIGVLLTFVGVVVFIPLMCTTRWAKNIHRGHERDLVRKGLQRFDGIICGVLRRARGVSVLSAVATLGFAAVALTLRPDDRMQDSQPTGSEAYQALAHCDQVLGGIEYVRVIVRWPERLRESSEVLTAIQEAESALAAEKLMKHPLSILGILAALPGDESVTSRLPFLELLPESIRSAWYDTKQRRAVVTVRIQDLGIARYESVFRRVEERLAGLAAKHPGFEFELTGDPVRRGRNLYRIVVDLARSLGAASVIIFVMLAVAYRSLRLGLISIIPNLFPLVVTASVLVALGRPLQIASVCAFTVCLGIAVDDTIHFLSRFREEIKVDGDTAEAIRRSFVGVGTAMIITTVILMAGFGTVLTSDLPGHRSFAAMAVSTIGAALVGDLLFLPALLACFPEKKASPQDSQQ